MNKHQHQQPKLHHSRKTHSARHAVPAAFSVKFENRPPRLTPIKDGIRVQHCEYIGTFETDDTNQFAYYADTLTPTNPELFPWLATIAERYESFKIHSATAMIHSAVGSTATGEFIMACDYDAKDPDSAQTESSLLNMAGAVDDNIWNGLSMTLDPVRMRKIGPMRFNEGGEETADRLNAAGTLYWALTSTNFVGPGAGTPLVYPKYTAGRRFIKYDIELTTPQLPSALLNQRAESPQIIAYTTSAGRLPAPAGVVVNSKLATGIQNVFANGDIDSASKFVELVVNGPVGGYQRYFDLAGNAVTAGMKLVKLKRDFQGIIRVVLPKLNFTAGTTVNPVDIGLEQFVEGAVSGPNVGPYGNAPDISDNSWQTLASTVVNSSTDGVFNADIAAKLAAGTIFSIVTGQTAGAAPLFTTTLGAACGLAMEPFAFSTAAAFARNDRDKFVPRHRARKNGSQCTRVLKASLLPVQSRLSPPEDVATTCGFTLVR